MLPIAPSHAALRRQEARAAPDAKAEIERVNTLSRRRDNDEDRKTPGRSQEDARTPTPRWRWPRSARRARHEKQEGSKRQLREAFMTARSVRRRSTGVCGRQAGGGAGQHEVLAVQFPGLLLQGQRPARSTISSRIGRQSLEGFARHAYEFYREGAQAPGLQAAWQVLDYPGGKPGDIGMFLCW